MPSRSALILFIAAVFLPVEAYAQRSDARRMRRDANRVKAVFLHEYRQALPKFDAAIKELESTLGDKAPKLSKVGKELEKQTDIFLRYVKFVNQEHPSFEPADLKAYSNTELGWETLTAAETLAALLYKVPEVENSTLVSLNFWKFLYLLEGELTRLKWMTARLR